MAQDTTEEITVSPEALKESIRKYDRTGVLKLLNENCMNLVLEEEKDEVLNQIVTLRDMNLMDCLAKQMVHFYPEMFHVDLNNHLNKDFINQVLDKHSDKFDTDNEDACKALFTLACEAGNGKLCASLIKNHPGSCSYATMASTSLTAFDQLLKIKPSTIDNDTLVDILFAAALTKDAQERLRDLSRCGYDIYTKNSDQKTVMALLVNRINGKSYPAGKRGVQMKQIEQGTLRFLNHLKEEEEKEAKKKKIITSAVIGGIVILAVIIGIAFFMNSRKASDTSDTNSTSSTSTDTSSTADTSTSTDTSSAASYATDTSLVVADGDTVNIDYVGYVDGVAFDGGNTQGAGTDLTIGSGSYIDDFEDQLIGHNVGDNVEVNVTFPDNYGSEELNGKDATFDVTINGIYE